MTSGASFSDPWPVERQISQDKFLPPSTSENASEKGLAYLLRLNPGLPLSPFTKQQTTAFLSARRWTLVNERTMLTGLIICTILACVPAIAALPPIRDWQNATPQNQSNMTVIVTLYAGVLSLINYLCTGTISDKAASTSLTREICTRDARTNYKDIAFRLLRIYKMNRPHAERIADRLNIPSISSLMSRYGLLESAVVSFWRPLDHARWTVQNGRPPDGVSPLMELYFHTPLGAPPSAAPPLETLITSSSASGTALAIEGPETA